MVTDSRYVHDTVLKIKAGTAPSVHTKISGTYIASHKDKLVSITWVKAHLEWEQAEARGISREHWTLNQKADEAATRGLTMHTEDPGAIALYLYRIRLIQDWQKHLLGFTSGANHS